VLEECDGAGLDRLLIVTNRRKPGLVDACEAIPSPQDAGTGIPARTVYFANQEQQRGLAHAILHGEAFVGDESFVVALADTIIDPGGASLIARMIAVHLEYGAAATFATERVPP